MPYKQITVKYTIEEALDKMEIEELRDEMSEWRDNMSGTSLENTSKYELVDEAASALDEVDNIDFDAIWDNFPEEFVPSPDEIEGIVIEVTQLFPPSKRQSPSRSYRLSNAIAHIQVGLEKIKDILEGKSDIQDVISAIDDVEDCIGNLDGVEFPGMFG